MYVIIVNSFANFVPYGFAILEKGDDLFEKSNSKEDVGWYFPRGASWILFKEKYLLEGKDDLMILFFLTFFRSQDPSKR